MRRVLCFLLFFPLSFLLQAQEIDEVRTSGIFPLSLVLDAENYSSVWRPDWPLLFPPDAFKVHAPEEISHCLIEIEAEDFSPEYQSSKYLSVEYQTLEYQSLENPLIEKSPIENPAIKDLTAIEGLKDKSVKLLKYPFVINEEIAQVNISYGNQYKIREINISFPFGGEGWQMEVLESKDSYPSIVRAFSADTWYFIYLFHSVNGIMETWYDETGVFIGAFGYFLSDFQNKKRIQAFKNYSDPGKGIEFYYDSRGLITEIVSFSGSYKALYFHDDLLRYWERRPLIGNKIGNFTLQWDKNDFLVKLSGDGGNETGFVDYRYEYTLDDRGNWIERQELGMTLKDGLVVPTSLKTIKRVLEYK